MNILKLQQDHPCVIEIIRRNYLTLPSDREKLNLNYPEVADQSAGQSTVVLTLLKNKVGGNTTF